MEAANNSALHKKPCAEYAATHCSAYQDQTKVMNIALLYTQRERDIGWMLWRNGYKTLCLMSQLFEFYFSGAPFKKNLGIKMHLSHFKPFQHL